MLPEPLREKEGGKMRNPTEWTPSGLWAMGTAQEEQRPGGPWNTTVILWALRNLVPFLMLIMTTKNWYWETCQSRKKGARHLTFELLMQEKDGCYKAQPKRSLHSSCLYQVPDITLRRHPPGSYPLRKRQGVVKAQEEIKGNWEKSLPGCIIQRSIKENGCS